MTQSPITSEGTPVYSAEDYDLAKRVNKFFNWIKKLLTSKEMIPVEATAIVRAINFLKSLPIPQLKLVCLVACIMVAIYCVVRTVVTQ